MLSNTCKYAIKALIYLGCNANDGRKIGIKKIAADLNIPSPFLGKIMQSLAKHKILTSTKGPNGGFGLGKPAQEISLYDIIKNVGGEDFFNNCLISLKPCASHTEEGEYCMAHAHFHDVRLGLMKFYTQTTLASFITDEEARKSLEL